MLKTTVVKLKCKVCKKFENNITSIKGFSRSWIVGTESVKKDSLSKHVQGDPHKYAANLQRKETLGRSGYQQAVIRDTPIGRGLTRMADKDRETLTIRFNTAYYLAKNERPYRDFQELIELQEKNGESIVLAIAMNVELPTL